MTIPIFDDGYRLKVVREQSLNPLIDKVNELDPKVKGLQTVVALSMTEPSVDVDGKRITFKKGGEGATLSLDLGPMFDSYQHGIGISGPTGGTIPDIEKIMFKNLTVRNTGNKSVEVTAPEVTGQVGATNARVINRLNITGNINGSSLDAGGTMTLNMPNNSIGAILNGSPSERVDKIRVLDSVAGSEISGDTLTIKMPDPIKGSIQGGGDFSLKSLKFQGNVGTSTEGGGDFIIELPGQEVDPGDGTFETYHKVRLKGNLGSSQVVNEVLEIDLPTGGGGGSTVNPLKVGEENGTPIPNVEELYFHNSEVKIATTRSGNKVLVKSKGTPVEKGDEPAKFVKQIKLTGDIETSDISDTGLLTLNIPHHEGLSVSDGKVVSKGITTLAFEDSEVVIDSSASPKATITPKGITGTLSGTTEPVKEIEITGTLGASTLSNGKLKIDLPAGGGGTGGADITGVVGSQSAKIDRIEVIGANTYNSSVAGTTLKVDIPRKPAIRGGTDQFSDIDIVEVANSTVTLDMAGGSRKALITPHIPFMGEGWFPTIEAMNAYIPETARIPTKTYGYITNAVTGETSMWIWMPDLTGGGLAPNWVEMPISGSLSLMENNHRKRGVLAVKQNPMVTIDGVGQMTITDTTVPNVLCQTLDVDGTNPIKKGTFNEVRFDDGEGVVDFDPTAFDLKIYRAQRRLAMGSDPDTSVPRFLDAKYEGSLWLNKTDGSWWGFNNKDANPGDKKWTKVIHRGMSSEVTDLSSRVPQKTTNIESTNPNDDNPLWLKSGWTHMDQDNDSLPTEVHGKTGGFIQTFVYKHADTGLDEKTQVLFLDSDASSYKRYFDTTSRKWNPWIKISFNPLELKNHNEDPHAHSKTHPFYKTVSFDCKYTDLKNGNGMLPINSIHLLGSSNGKHKINDDKIASIPYSGKYRIRGRLYFSGISASPSAADNGNWFLSLQKRSNSGAWSEVSKVEYDHHTGTMVYPPLWWDIQNVTLSAGDELQIKMWFQPKAGTTVEDWLKIHPNIGFYGLRSFVSVDEQDNDGGYALGETHRKLHGKFASLGDAGVKAFKTNPSDTAVRVIGETVATNFTQMM